jgi:hypothetical protein
MELKPMSLWMIKIAHITTAMIQNPHRAYGLILEGKLSIRPIKRRGEAI